MTNLQLPPPAVLAQLRQPEVIKLAREYRRLDELERELQAQAHKLRTAGMAEARTADTDSVADAVRNEKPIPKATAVDKAQAALDELERHLAGASQAKAGAARELIQAIEAARAKMDERLEDEALKRREALRTAVVALDGAQGELGEVLARQRWVRDFPRGKPFRAAGGHIMGLQRRSGESYAWREVLDALHAAADGSKSEDTGPQLVPGMPQMPRPQAVQV